MEKLNRFSNRLKALRLEEGLTAEELSVKLGFARTTYSNWESGIREPNMDIIIKIADFYNVTVDYLLGRADHKEGAIACGNVDGHNVKVEYDANKYLEGFTPEELERVYRLAIAMKEQNIL